MKSKFNQLKDEIKLFLETTLGEKSHLNLLGKIIFFPIIIAVGMLFLIVISLFEVVTKD